MLLLVRLLLVLVLPLLVLPQCLACGWANRMHRHNNPRSTLRHTGLQAPYLPCNHSIVHRALVWYHYLCHYHSHSHCQCLRQLAQQCWPEGLHRGQLWIPPLPDHRLHQVPR